MKKVFMISLVCVLSFMAFADDYIMSQEMYTQVTYPQAVLPEKAIIFLNTHFPNVQILYVEQDWNELEVNLNNGTEISFTKDGDWYEVDARYQAVPTAIIPSAILATIETMYVDAYIISIEKEWADFEIKLNNRFELKMDANGKVYEIDYDD